MADSSGGMLRSLYRDLMSQIDSSSPNYSAPPVTATGGTNGEKDVAVFKKTFRDIRLQVDVGLKLHKMRRTKVDSQFMDLYTELNLLIDPIESLQNSLFEGAPRFDFIQPDGTPVKANGYRSLLYVLKELLLNLLSHLQKYARDRGSAFYNAADCLSNITAYTRALQGMERIFHNALALMTVSDSPTLYNNGEMKKSLISLLFTESICRDTFYGRCLGFQYTQGLKPILQFLAIAMASYEEWYKGTKEDPVKQLFSSFLKGGKYIQHPTQRGIKISDLTDECSIYFAKAFWSLTEQTAVKTAVKMVSQAVELSQCIEAPAKNIIINTVTGEEITLQPPFSELGYRPIPMTLISYKLREGQVSNGFGKKMPIAPSTGLIIHFHGGGFIAQSSKSHEFYLRWWSKELNCPVLSVDYSLAPEAPYPRAVDECAFVYAWALNNLDILGTTGERILLAGDSAGGYFCLTTAMKINQLGLRPPDQVFAYYPATLISSAVSPSRFLSLMDPLLPIGILLSCLQAYTGSLPSDEVRARRKEIRDKILSAKGYIIPSLHDPYVAAKPQTRMDIIKAKVQRSQSAPENVMGTKPVKSAPPARPPPPKATTTNSNSPPTSKPSRPPPPNVAPRRATIGPISMEMQSSSVTVTFDKIEEEEEEKQTVTAEDETIEEENVQDLAEVDLDKDTSTDETAAEQQQKPSGPLPAEPEQSMLTSMAAFFPKSSEEGSSLRFGMRVPAQEELMNEKEMESLVDEVMATFQDPEITTTDPFISPLLAPDDLLKGLPLINLIVCSLDPLLDDGVMMAQRLKALDQPVTLTVMNNLSHGFLSLTGTEQINAAHVQATAMMKEALKTT